MSLRKFCLRQNVVKKLVFVLGTTLVYDVTTKIIKRNFLEDIKMTLVKFNNGQRRNVVAPRFVDAFDSIFNEQFFAPAAVSKVPAVNITESEAGFVIELAAPGLKKEDFKVNLDKNLLTVAAEVKKDEAAEAKNYTKKEFSFSSFSRSFTLPESVDQTKIEAEYADGILKLAVAKKEEAKLQAREISVK
ncbi:Hsp20/alpha crystallin family protein [Mucilaginibacter sp. CSA2-8R]|uniref:Hsp20/alpha crystallin family protein n=1 Tax=Mucilaginibacter sp. CSA2-8R TaxID=3141542 RepID=UPI00315CDBD7